MITNTVDKETLRKIQGETLNMLKGILEKSFGPYGSNTIIIKEGTGPRYTKDGHTILSSVMFKDPISKAVQADIEEETRTQAIKIGDSTTSITILSALIFEKLAEYEKNNETIPPADIVIAFKEVANAIAETIKTYGREATIEDMKNIALISTNNNEKLAQMLETIYREYGTDVYIDVKASMNGTTYVKELNGMVLECGFLDPSLINDPVKNTCEIRNPKIYVFDDPIDTAEMGMFMDVILNDNIIKPMHEKNIDNIIPTIIMAPRISRDYSAYMNQLMSYMAQVNSAQKGFLNIITNIEGCDQDQYADIRDFCGCKPIKKYIDPEVQREQIALGNAPTPETIHKFAGTAELVSSDMNKTTFINPAMMYDENGNPSELYEQRLTYLENNIETLKVEGTNTKDIYEFKKRLNSLKGKMVEVYIGGVTISDRDQERDLMEDAVLNCRSAAVAGVGYGGNFEGLRASKEVFEKYRTDVYSNCHMAKIIYDAYNEISALLYKTEGFEDSVNQIVSDSLKNGCPYNLRTKEFDHMVLSSIDTDVCSIETISKIITIMATSNQAILPTFNINNY